MTIAVTGATGFVGGHVLERLTRDGHQARALTRRPMPPRAGVEWVAGDLANAAALASLVRDCTAVIHVAGVLNAPDRGGFEAGNVTGTANLLDAATSANVPRFVHTSSLAAREPNLSLYGGSKARSEALVVRSTLEWAIVRPPAVYGPGDRETLELFKMAKLRLMLMPPTGRLSLLHVDDLARLLIGLATGPGADRQIIEPDDGTPRGWTHRDFATALGTAVGTQPRVMSAPAPLLRFAARADHLVRGARAKLTPDRAAYFLHPDWVADPGRAAPPELWRAEIDTSQGLADTARWYRAHGWL